MTRRMEIRHASITIGLKDKCIAAGIETVGDLINIPKNKLIRNFQFSDDNIIETELIKSTIEFNEKMRVDF